MKSAAKVLMIGPDPRGASGISAVISSYRKNEIWERYRCKWLGTYIDRVRLVRAIFAVKAYLLGFVQIPQHDIIHIHGARQTSLARKMGFLLIARCFRKKTIFHLHGGEMEAFQKNPLRAVGRHIFSRADVVIALSKTWARMIREVAPAANIVVISNPVDIPPQYAEYDGEREAIVLFVGRLDPRKGFHELIRAMPQIIANHPDARLCIAGSGDVKLGQKIANESNISKHVEFLGWTTGAKKENLLRKASVFCLPSYAEGLPITMLEAMAYRVPVVVTPVGGIPDIITDGWNGLFVTPGSANQIAMAVLRLLNDHDLAISLSERGYETVRRSCSLDTICEQLSVLYEELFKG